MTGWLVFLFVSWETEPGSLCLWRLWVFNVSDLFLLRDISASEVNFLSQAFLVADEGRAQLREVFWATGNYINDKRLLSLMSLKHMLEVLVRGADWSHFEAGNILFRRGWILYTGAIWTDIEFALNCKFLKSFSGRAAAEGIHLANGNAELASSICHREYPLRWSELHHSAIWTDDA
jgi:hypothetical protein